MLTIMSYEYNTMTSEKPYPTHFLSYPFPTNNTESYLNFGTTGLFVTASATQPPIKHSPPSGVTGPRNLNRCGSSTSKYIEPENMAIPAVKRPMATVFCGATTDAKVRTAEWTSCGEVVST